jgi:hypothetical protein
VRSGTCFLRGGRECLDDPAEVLPPKAFFIKLDKRIVFLLKSNLSVVFMLVKNVLVNFVEVRF